MRRPDPSTLPGLLGSAGKSLASLPGARRVVERLKHADSPQALAGLLQSIDLGLDEPARSVIADAAMDPARWRDVHALLVRSAEATLHDRFSSSA